MIDLSGFYAELKRLILRRRQPFAERLYTNPRSMGLLFPTLTWPPFRPTSQYAIGSHIPAVLVDEVVDQNLLELSFWIPLASRVLARPNPFLLLGVDGYDGLAPRLGLSLDVLELRIAVWPSPDTFRSGYRLYSSVLSSAATVRALTR